MFLAFASLQQPFLTMEMDSMWNNSKMGQVVAVGWKNGPKLLFPALCVSTAMTIKREEESDFVNFS